MRRLLLSQIDEDFDPSTHVAIAPRCFLDRETVFPNWENLEFISPLSDPETQFDEAIKLSYLANDKLQDIAARLNAEHNRAYSTGYWRALLMPWLMNMVMVTRKRFLEMEAFIDEHRDENFEVEIFSSDANWQFHDNDDLWERGLRHPLFDFWLGSLACEQLAPKTWKLKRVNRSIPPAPQFPADEGANHPILELRDKLFGRLPILGGPGLRQGAKTLLSLYISSIAPFGNRGPDNERPTKVFPADQKTYSSAFLEMIDNVLTCTLPQTYGTLFTVHETAANLKTYKPGRIFLISGGYLHHSISGKFEAAHAFEAGEKIISTQHGAGYGLAKSFPLFSEVEYQNHAFLSWGWTEHTPYISDAVAIASPFLANFRNRPHSIGGSHLLYTGTEIPAPANRLNSEPEPVGFLRYRKIKIAFINNLEPPARDALLYRPYPKGLGRLDDLDYLNREIGPLPVAEGLHDKLMLDSKLYVIDYPGTPLLTALSANVPIVCIWEDKSWPMTDQANVFFDALRDCKILHESGESAAMHVNEIWPDIERWWLSEEVQTVRDFWLQNHATSSRFWWTSWLKALWSLNRLPRRTPPRSRVVPSRKD